MYGFGFRKTYEQAKKGTKTVCPLNNRKKEHMPTKKQHKPVLIWEI